MRESSREDESVKLTKHREKDLDDVDDEGATKKRSDEAVDAENKWWGQKWLNKKVDSYQRRSSL